MLKKYFKRFFLLFVMIMCLLVGSNGIYAYSDSVKAKLPGTSYYVQSNVWQNNVFFWKTHKYKVSAKLFTSKSCKTPTKASSIKTSWHFKPVGINVSCKGISADTTNSNGFSGSWTNTNTWISDMSGSFRITGLPLFSSLTNTAFAVKSGVKASATAECFRFY